MSAFTFGAEEIPHEEAPISPNAVITSVLNDNEGRLKSTGIISRNPDTGEDTRVVNSFNPETGEQTGTQVTTNVDLETGIITPGESKVYEVSPKTGELELQGGKSFIATVLPWAALALGGYFIFKG